MLGEHSRQSAALDRAISGLPVEREYFSERHSSILLNFTIEFYKGYAHLQGQFGTQRGLPGSAEPDQTDALPAQLFPGTEVPHQPEDHVFKAMIGKTFEES